MYTLIALILDQENGKRNTTAGIVVDNDQHRLAMPTGGILRVIGSYLDEEEAFDAKERFCYYLAAHHDPLEYVPEPTGLDDCHCALKIWDSADTAPREVRLKQGEHTPINPQDSFCLYGGFATADDALTVLPLTAACQMRRRAFEQTPAEA
ncbi:MAG: hypothetical protein AAB776_01885 [Patescibacteria group bacterium]